MLTAYSSNIKSKSHSERLKNGIVSLTQICLNLKCLNHLPKYTNQKINKKDPSLNEAYNLKIVK